MTEETLFAEAIERPPGERAAFLAAYATDPGLRRRVAALLAAYERAGDFLAAPAITPPGDDLPTVIVAGPALPPDLAGGRYRVLRPLGEGGMGVVYLAEQAAPVRREVAIKVVRPGMGSAAALARFDAERQALAVMDHPHIATVFDGGTTADGRPYFVMEYVPGDPITLFCAARKLSLAERLELFALVCRAVHHAHQKGVIHRDLKPGNVLVVERDGKAVPKVIDFGVAKALDARLAGVTADTAVGTVVGTPAYMSPEQADLNAADVDTRSDIYALAVLLYELLTGTTPFGRDHPNDTPVLEQLRIVREVEPPPPSTMMPPPRPALARELDWVVLKGLAKDRDRRYESAAALAEDVRRLLANEPVEAGPPSRWYRWRKFVARNKAGVAAAVVAAAAVTAGGAAAAVGFVRAEQTNDANKALIADVIAKSTQATEAEARAVTERDTAAAVSGFLGKDLLPFAATEFQLDRGMEPDPNVTLRAVLDQAGSRIDGRFPDNPRAEAQVRLAVGRTYSYLNEHAKAKLHLGRAKELVAHYPPDSAEGLTILHASAAMNFNRGAYAEAEAEYRALVAPFERVHGPTDVKTFALRTQLATVGTFAPPTAAHEAAFAVLRRECEAALTPDHDQSCRILVQSAIYAIRRNKPAEAKALATDAVDRRLRTTGPTHAQTWHAQLVLAQALRANKEGPAARDLLAAILPDQRRILSADHRDTVLTAKVLGELYLIQGDYPRAEELLAEAWAWQQKYRPPEHPERAGIVNNLAMVHIARGAFEKAEPLLTEAVAVSEKTLGPDHDTTLNVMNNAAMCLQFRKLYARAEPIFADAVGRFRTAKKTDSVGYRRVLMGYAFNQFRQAKYAAAEPLFAECLTEYRRATPKDYNVIRSEMYVGAALANLKKYDAAETHLLAAHRGIVAHTAAKKPGYVAGDLEDAVGFLADLYQASGQPEKAAEWKAKAKPAGKGS